MIIYVKSDVNPKTRKFINKPKNFINYVNKVMKENGDDFPVVDVYDGLTYIDSYCDNLDISVKL